MSDTCYQQVEGKGEAQYHERSQYLIKAGTGLIALSKWFQNLH